MFYLSLLSKKNREDQVFNVLNLKFQHFFQLSDDEFAVFSSEKFREIMAPKIFEVISRLKENYTQVRLAMETEKNPVLKAYGLSKNANIPLQFIKCCFKANFIQLNLIYTCFRFLNCTSLFKTLLLTSASKHCCLLIRMNSV